MALNNLQKVTIVQSIKAAIAKQAENGAISAQTVLQGILNAVKKAGLGIMAAEVAAVLGLIAVIWLAVEAVKAISAAIVTAEERETNAQKRVEELTEAYGNLKTEI